MNAFKSLETEDVIKTFSLPDDLDGTDVLAELIPGAGAPGPHGGALTRMVSEIESNGAADVAGGLSDDSATEVFSQLDSEGSEKARRPMWEGETAGARSRTSRTVSRGGSRRAVSSTWSTGRRTVTYAAGQFFGRRTLRGEFGEDRRAAHLLSFSSASATVAGQPSASSHFFRNGFRLQG